MEPTVSGVGVLDKAVSLLRAVADRPRTHAELMDDLGYSRATTHRLLIALELHGLIRRDPGGRFGPGMGLAVLGQAALDQRPVATVAREALDALREHTGESAQLYLREGDQRVCVAVSESPHGLRTIVEVGARLTLKAGSAAQFLVDHPSPEVLGQGWAESIGEREPGVASVSAPVHKSSGEIIAAVSVSGPIDRTGLAPGQRYAEAVQAAAQEIERRLQ